MSLLSQKSYVAKTNNSIKALHKESTHAPGHMSISNGVKKFTQGEQRLADCKGNQLSLPLVWRKLV